MTFLLSCEHAAEALGAHHEGTLDWATEVRLRVHLRTCPACCALSATLLRVPELVRHALATAPDLDPALCQARGREALAAVLPRLGREPRRYAPDALIPEVFRDLDPQAQDTPWRILALAHRCFQPGAGRAAAGFLPEEVLALLPPVPTWRWVQHGGLRMVDLLEEAGVRLRLLQAPAGFQLPRHAHDGSESILVLAGGMADHEGAYDPGRWVHFPEGSAHAPCMSEEGCVCLVREVGGQHLTGPLGWLRSALA